MSHHNTKYISEQEQKTNYSPTASGGQIEA